MKRGESDKGARSQATPKTNNELTLNRMNTSKLSLYAAVAVSLSVLLATADPPDWWENRGAVMPETATLPNEVVTQGQAKHMAQAALAEFNVMLAPLGGAGPDIEAMIGSDWFQDTSGNSGVCLQAHGKTLAAPFYDRLHDLNVSLNPNVVSEGSYYPWTSGATDDADLSPLVYAQLKQLFSFDLDVDGDGLPDWWEERLFGTMEENGTDDFDGDGLLNLAEFGGNTAAHLADSDRDGLRDGEDGEPTVYNAPALRQPPATLEISQRGVRPERVVGPVALEARRAEARQRQLDRALTGETDNLEGEE